MFYVSLKFLTPESGYLSKKEGFRSRVGTGTVVNVVDPESGSESGSKSNYKIAYRYLYSKCMILM
jgi:hypothetical protein